LTGSINVPITDWYISTDGIVHEAMKEWDAAHFCT